MMLRAITASTGAWGTCTQPKVAAARVRLWAMVNAVMVATRRRQPANVLRTAACGQRWVFGLAFDGRHLVTVSTRKSMHLLDPETFETVRSMATHYPLRAVGFDGGRYLLMEQPVFGHGIRHERMRVWPEETVVHRLRLSSR